MAKAAAVVDDAVLSKKQLAALNQALARIDKAIDLIDMSETCGNDCQELRAAVDEARMEVVRIKATFFPLSP